MTDHEHFDELAALAAVGFLSDEEHMDFRQHLQNCPACQAALEEFTQLVCSGIPGTEGFIREFRHRMKTKTDDGMRARFLSRARREGIVFSFGVEEQKPSRLEQIGAVLRVVAAVVPVFLLALFGPWLYRQTMLSGSVQSAERIQQLQKQNISLSADISQLNQSLTARQQEIETLRAQLDAAKSAALHRDGQTGRDLTGANNRNVQLENELANSEQLLANAQSEAHRINQMTVNDAASLTAQQNRIRELSNQLRLANATLDMERKLTAAGKDIRELLTARQLHVIDVRDTDVDGNPSEAFGRVFVSEGRSLTFYAFDLTQDRAVNAKYRFEVWGSQQASKSSVQKLGFLYEDDKADRRWALKIDNPELIKEIDSVFVTIEPYPGSQTPNAARLLYAYLGQPPNHP